MTKESDDRNTRPAESEPSVSARYRIGENGVILGPDGKPCKACNSLKAFGAVTGKVKPKTQGQSTTKTAATSAAAEPVPIDEYKSCPADVETLGRHTWTFLHSTAAYYPEKPSEAHKRNALGLFGSLPSLYPCRYCADELEVEMRRLGPPDVTSRSSLSIWLCQIHNEVNVRLGKREFDCSRVLERWKEGWSDGSCG